MNRMATTEADLQWWFDVAARLEWTVATTYAATAPHSYIVHPKTTGLAPEDYVRAAHVIHTFGQPGKYYSMTSIYLTSPDGRLKWWTMDEDLDRTDLINQATTDRLYGVQNAPSTHSGVATDFDAIATRHDRLHPVTDDERDSLRDALETVRGPYTPSVLDVGCGTGRILDLGVTTPDRYAGVDPSQPMLNMLVRKHPTVAAIYPESIETSLADGRFTPGQFELVTLCRSAEWLSDTTIDALASIASRALVIVDSSGEVIIRPAAALAVS